MGCGIGDCALRCGVKRSEVAVHPEIRSEMDILAESHKPQMPGPDDLAVRVVRGNGCIGGSVFRNDELDVFTCKGYILDKLIYGSGSRRGIVCAPENTDGIDGERRSELAAQAGRNNSGSTGCLNLYSPAPGTM